MPDTFQTPILLTIFNRPDLSTHLWGEIKKIKPSVLYIAADGPRADNKNDQRLCAEVRQIVTQDINWVCDLQLLFREENLGCGQAISSAITWFFQHVSEGIILEDDCLPHPDFFPFCSKLLERYRDDDKVFMISGSSVPKKYEKNLKVDYCFTHIPSAWGWATWRRSWDKYDFSLSSFEQFKQEQGINKIFPKKQHQTYWLDYFNEIKHKNINNWDYQLAYTSFKGQGLCIRPKYNLINNLGIKYGNGATKLNYHQTGQKIYTHPIRIEADKQADDIIMHLLLSPTHKLKNILKKLGLFYSFKKLYQRL